MRRHNRWLRPIMVAMLSAFILLNGLAWMQARAMTHYAPGGPRTPRPEALSLGEKAWAVLAGVTVPRPGNNHTPAGVGLEYESRTIPVEGGDYLEGWFVTHAGANGLVLMFPGYAESKESLLPAASTLHALGYNLLMLDFRGVGGSSGNDTTLGVREAKDVARAVQYARLQWPGHPLVLYGVSMGGAAVMRAIAVEGVRVNAAIVESPFDSLLHTVRNRFHSMGLPGTPGAELIVLWGSVQQGFNGFEHNPVDYASSIACPTLLLYGDNDPRVTPAEARSIYDRLPRPKAFASFRGAGHEALAVYAPERWKEQVGQFLAGFTLK
ncbi:MAG TPA: alpha/beta fold hydrolase [Chloroflexia bacterium]|nr:alpha/beta fold hydrolase [Chloroflexia bacterium]